jgi:predicted MPP superfamily phosphohydrolase
LIFVYAAFLLLHPDEEGRVADLIWFALLVMFIASQVFWIRRVFELGRRSIPLRTWRIVLTVFIGALYALPFAYLFAPLTAPIFRASDHSLRGILLVALFWWWFVGSFLGFFLVVAFWIVDRAARVAGRLYHRGREMALRRALAVKSGAVALDPPSPGRRRFLGQAAVAVSATPFVASAYGLLYGRLDLEITHQRVVIHRLPKGLEGFSIAQLSDFHISPFTPAERIRRYATITNRLKPDLIALTGDYIGWDPETQRDVVQALAALRASCGVFGCLGNHDYDTGIEASIAHLFAGERIRILRQERAPVQWNGEMLNLIGIDYEQLLSSDHPGHKVDRYLEGCERLVTPDLINVLLSHNPNVFDRAAEMRIDLTLAGHTHGGQLSLEFIHRGLCLSRLATPYVSGLYQKPGGQLYVNRGIGTTGFPMRVGARPEITLIKLACEG